MEGTPPYSVTKLQANTKELYKRPVPQNAFVLELSLKLPRETSKVLALDGS